MNNFRSVTRTSGLQNIGNSFKGIVFGIILIILSIILLWYNEGKAVHVAKSLDEGAGIVTSVSVDKIDTKNEGKLIHLSGLAETKDTLIDTDFNIKVNALKLSRNVQYYQWVEKAESKTTDKIGGGTETVTDYTYNKEWVSNPINSGDFKVPEGHQNLLLTNINEIKKTATNINLGSFSLNDNVVDLISGSEPLSINAIDTNKINNCVLNNNVIYIGSKNSQYPQVGDLNVSYKVLYPKKISVVAKQISNSLEEFFASNNETILLVENGIVSADNMFKSAIEGNTFRTWIFRFVGFMLMFFGFKALLGPFVAVGNIIPFVGKIVSAGTSLISLILALPLSLIVIAIAWFVYRPILSLSLIAIALGLYVWYRRYKAQKKSDNQTNSNNELNSTINASIPVVTDTKNNTNENINDKTSDGLKIVHITADMLRSVNAGNFAPDHILQLLKKEGIEINVTQMYFQDASHHETPQITEVGCCMSFSLDAIEYMNDNVLEAINYETKAIVYNPKRAVGQALSYIKFYYFEIVTKTYLKNKIHITLEKLIANADAAQSSNSFVTIKNCILAEGFLFTIKKEQFENQSHLLLDCSVGETNTLLTFSADAIKHMSVSIDKLEEYKTNYLHSIFSPNIDKMVFAKLQFNNYDKIITK